MFLNKVMVFLKKKKQYIVFRVSRQFHFGSVAIDGTRLCKMVCKIFKELCKMVCKMVAVQDGVQDGVQDVMQDGWSV